MKRQVRLLLAFLSAMILSSCFQFETEITVNKDGSGTIVEEMILGAQMVQMMEMAAAQGGGADQNPLADLKDEAKAKQKAASYGESVSLVKIEDVNKDGGKGVRVTYKFTDINKVSFNPSGAVAQMGDLDESTSEALAQAKDANATFKLVDGKLTITLPDGEDEGDLPEDTDNDLPDDFDPNDPQMAMMMEMFKGMKMGAKVTVKPGIAETNATHRNGDTITLFEVNFDQLLKNPAGMKSLQKINMRDRAKAAEALANVDGATAETKKEVTIAIK